MAVIVPEELVGVLRRARHVVVFTSAGVSAESGIATFRDPLTGLWERFDAEELATRQAFRKNPDLVWGWYEARRAGVMRASPNAAHGAIAAMERRVETLTLVTQNVDDLHERAGSSAADPPAREFVQPALVDGGLNPRNSEDSSGMARLTFRFLASTA